MSEPVAQPKTLVLNVNDSDDMRFAISAMLKRADFDVLEAATGEEALAVIEQHEPHLVVLDIHLPGANGYEVCRSVRKNPFRGTMRILHTSAMSVSLEDKIESLESGADGFLEQPFELEALLSCVRSLLDSDQGIPRGASAVPDAPKVLDSPPRSDHVLQMLEQIGDGVICLDDAWRFTFVNAMAESTLGRKRDELLGANVWTAVPALEATSFGNGCRRAMTERVAVSIDEPWARARALPTPQGLLVLFQAASAARGEETTFVGQRSKTLRGIGI